MGSPLSALCARRVKAPRRDARHSEKVEGGAIDFDVPEAAEFRQGLVERVAFNIEAYEAPQVLHGLVETRAAYREV